MTTSLATSPTSLAKRPEENLTELERETYDKWRRGPDQTPLSPMVALKMYELFLLGHSCDDIVKANENKFPLGMVLHARVMHEWDRRRTSYLDKLYEDATNVIKQRQIESALFLGDLLAVAHKEYGQKFKTYIQTGDPSVLKDLGVKVTSLTTYKMAIDAFMKITGQEKGGKGDGGPLVQINAQNVGMADGKMGPISGSQGFSLLQALEQTDDQEQK